MIFVHIIVVVANACRGVRYDAAVSLLDEELYTLLRASCNSVSGLIEQRRRLQKPRSPEAKASDTLRATARKSMNTADVVNMMLNSTVCYSDNVLCNESWKRERRDSGRDAMLCI